MQTNQHQWQPVTAWLGGTVAGVAVSPHFLIDHLALAATPAGIYRSTDGGQQWAWSSAGISEPMVLAVGFAPALADGTTLAWASTQGGRLFRSADGGITWSELTAWAGLGVISSLLFSPAFARDQTGFVTTAAGVLRTQDGGQHWESCTFGLHDLQTLCLGCVPDFASGEQGQNELLWVGTAAGGFYRSRNAGRSWRDVGAGLPDDALACLLVSPRFAEDQTLYVATESAGLYHSTDGGVSWALCNDELAAASATALAITPDQRLLLGTGAGLHWSEDGGRTWALASGGEFVATALAVAEDGTLLAGALHSGLHRSTDGGKSWQSVNTGLAAHAPPLVSRGADQTSFALDNQGWLAGCSASGAWALINSDEDAPLLTAFASVMDAEIPALFATATDGTLWRAEWLAGQAQWEKLATIAEEGRHFTALTVANKSARPPRLYLADQAGWVYGWMGQTELRPINESVPWVGETLLHLALSPDATTSESVLAISTRRGATGHYRLQLWESADGGQQWAHLAALVSEIPAVALAWPVDPHEQALFVATRHRVIKLFYQGPARELTSTQSFLDKDLTITALAASPTYATDQTLWAATTRGIYQSTDRGSTWQPVGRGLAERSIVALFPPTADQPLQVVTLGGEVWQLS